MSKKYNVLFTWDDEAEVWIATSKDIRGLVLEDESFDALVHEVSLAAPTLLKLNEKVSTDITLDFSVFRQERLAV